MKYYRLIVDFHAENDSDAQAQMRLAQEAFDDGYEGDRLISLVERQAPSRCPRCEGYEATYHTFEGECSERVK